MVIRLVTVLVLCVALGGDVQAQGLFAYDGTFDSLYEMQSGPVVANFIGTDPNSGIVPEIEFGGGIIYANDTGDNTNLHRMSPATGAVLSTITLTFPVGGNVITSMEFVNGTLYAGLTTEGGGDTGLATINTTTGDVTLVGGLGGIGSPLGGLAWDGASLYGVTAGGSAAELWTFDIGSGVATFETTVNAVTGAPIGLTALEFGNDGMLYALPNIQSGIGGDLLSIDPTSGIFSNLGSTGVEGMNALTSVPEPAMVCVSGMIGVSLFMRRRRRH